MDFDLSPTLGDPSADRPSGDAPTLGSVLGQPPWVLDAVRSVLEGSGIAAWPPAQPRVARTVLALLTAETGVEEVDLLALIRHVLASPA